MGFLDKFKKSRRAVGDEVAAGMKDGKTFVDSKKAKEVKQAKKDTVSSASKQEESKARPDARIKVAGSAYRILIRPLISEKATEAENLGKYTFVVANNADKIRIKRAVEEVYGVDVKSVRIINSEGKKVRFGQTRGKRSGWKKAIVTLQKNQSIAIHEGV